MICDPIFFYLVCVEAYDGICFSNIVLGFFFVHTKVVPLVVPITMYEMTMKLY